MSMNNAGCEDLMCRKGLHSRADARKWLLTHHPDKGGSGINVSEVGTCFHDNIYCPEETEKELMCNKLMCEKDLHNRAEAIKWLKIHHPDKGGSGKNVDEARSCFSDNLFCKNAKAASATAVSPETSDDEEEEDEEEGDDDESNASSLNSSGSTATEENNGLQSLFRRVERHSGNAKSKPETYVEPAYKANKRQLECIRQVSNWSKITPQNRFDKKRFDIEQTDKIIPIASPKLEAMLQNIEALDADDRMVHGKTFKHFIFSDIRMMGYGAKIISAGLIARGWKPVLKQVMVKTKRGKMKSDIAVEIPPLSKGKGKTNDRNFAVLSSTPLWEAPFNPKLKKEILTMYNKRPDNIQGENCRLIVLDSGFKEGIDLFDIKYVHLFEPLMTAADMTQALGRATRLCGQKGLVFVPNEGWRLHVFKYSQNIPASLQLPYKAATLFDIALQLKGLDTRLHKITKSINDVSILSAVDQPLNEEIHKSGFLPHITIVSDKSLPKSGHNVELVSTSEVMDLGKGLGRPDLQDEETRGQMLENIAASGPESIADLDTVASDPCHPIIPAGCSGQIVPFRPNRNTPDVVITPKLLMDKIDLVLRQPSLSSGAKSDKKGRLSWFELRKSILENYSDMMWPPQEVINKCIPKGGALKKTVKKGKAGKKAVVGKKEAAGKKALPGKKAVTKKVAGKKGLPVKKPLPGEKKAVAGEKKPLAGEKKGLPVKRVSAKAQKKAEKQPSVQKQTRKKNTSWGLKLVDYTPTQAFLSSYFSVDSPVKGMLLWHSVGTGKTCSAIAVASKQWEPAGYTILWVTRHTLKSDIWKNIFDQVCHVEISKEVKEGKLTPEDVPMRQQRMYQQWLPPMSYKQFSNLVTGKNPLYNLLVSRNGKKDPLRKTFIVIDEAHKLYASDFKGSEKPDVGAFKDALENSYKVSGKDSARVLLMSATPYNESPMEMLALLNLCRPAEEQFPTEVPEFIEKYMDENGMFTARGLKTYMDDIAGHISYLNREADPSQFAQPVFAEIEVPISTFEEGDGGNLQEALAALDMEENELAGTIPYIEQQIALINTSEEGKMKECSTIYDRVKDVKTCQKRVSETYKDAWKLETKHLKEAKARLEKIGTEKNKLIKNNEKFTKRMRKTSLSQQAQLEGRCKIGLF